MENEMPKWRKLDEDVDKVEWFTVDDDTGEEVIRTDWKHTDKVLEANKAIQSKEVGRGKDMHHVARIPPSIIMKWMEEGINIYDKNHGPAVMRKLDDPEYRHLRVNTQQLGKRTRHI